MPNTTAKPTNSKTDIYARATNRVIALMEQGHVAWRRTWGSYGYARNFKTNHVYTGINFLLMNFCTERPVPYYLTYRQAKEMGGNIKKGAKSEKVFFYKSYYKDANGNSLSADDLNLPKYENQEIESIRFLRCYSVFNIEDTESIEWERPPEVSHDNDPIRECEIIIEEMPERPTFTLTNANQAFYAPDTDTINVPKLEQFENSEFYYRTTFHEIAHWTGAAHRLNRPGITEPVEHGSDRYAEEELIAELTSNYLLNIAGVDTTEVMEVSAGYLKSWIKRLQEDPKMLFRVTPKAQAATEFILSKSIADLPV